MGESGVVIDLGRLFADHEYLKQALAADSLQLAAALQARRYPMIPREFVAQYLEHLKREHLENPQAARYLESELGAPGRQAQFLGWLTAAGFRIAGRSCIDVGCNNGSLALACAAAGARRVLGVDVSAPRLASARELCRGTPVELRKLDILEQDLPEEFDAVLCTDVLEHVPDPARMIRRLGELLGRRRGSFACVTLFNKLHPESVLSEPHYDVPGMVLLEHGQASRLWGRIRERYRSKLDYEVFHWHTWDEYAEMARRAGLRLRALGGRRRARAARRELREFRRTFDELEVKLGQKLEAAPLTAEEREELRDATTGYLAQARLEHEAWLRDPSPDRTHRLYYTYHAQPLVMILQRPGWIDRVGLFR